MFHQQRSKDLVLDGRTARAMDGDDPLSISCAALLAFRERCADSVLAVMPGILPTPATGPTNDGRRSDFVLLGFAILCDRKWLTSCRMTTIAVHSSSNNSRPISQARHRASSHHRPLRRILIRSRRIPRATGYDAESNCTTIPATSSTAATTSHFSARQR